MMELLSPAGSPEAVIAAVQNGAVGGIGKLGVIGMYGVRVVAREHHGAGEQTAVIGGVGAERERYPLKRVLKESGRRALLRRASDFFVVEDAHYRYGLVGLASDEGFK